MADRMQTPEEPQPRPVAETSPLRLLLLGLALGGLTLSLLWWVMVPRPGGAPRPAAAEEAPGALTTAVPDDTAPPSPPAAVPPEIPQLPDPPLQKRLNEYRDRVTASPADAAKWGDLAMVLHANALYGQAAECYDEAARLNPEQGDWHYLGGLSRTVEDLDGAIARVRTATSLYGDAPFAKMMLIELLVNRGEVDEAARLMDETDLTGIEEARTLASAGQLALIRGQAEEAKAAGERAAALKPGVRQIHGMLAAAYQRLGRADDARVQQELASKSTLTWSDPVQDRMLATDQGIVVVLRTARDWLNAKRVPEATALLEKAVVEYPDNPQAWQRLGECYRASQQDAKAEVALARAVAISPDFVDALLPLGMLKVISGRGADAHAIAEHVVQLEPRRFQGQLLLAMSLQSLQRHPEAIAAYKKAAEISPGSAKPLVGIANSLATNGDLAGALELVNQAVKVDPNDPSPQVLLQRLRSQMWTMPGVVPSPQTQGAAKP